MTTPLDLLALLAAYKVNPDDPVRMLVLADWLEENGGPLLAARGEFVRLQPVGQHQHAHGVVRVDLVRGQQGQQVGGRVHKLTGIGPTQAAGQGLELAETTGERPR